MKKNKWELAKICLECKKEQVVYGRAYCFEHRWENPNKLKKDKKELKLIVSVLAICFLILYLILIHAWISFLIFEKATIGNKTFISFVVILTLIALTGFIWFLTSVFKEQWQELKIKQSWWIRK